MDRKTQREFRLLKAYAVVSSMLLTALLIMGAANGRKKEKLDEIDATDQYR